MFVGHGVTRRHFSVGIAATLGSAAVAFGAAVLIGHGLEYALHVTTGHFARPGEPYVLASGADVGSTFAAYAVLYAAHIGSGWLIGAAFYRFGPWGGILLIPPFAAPALIVDFVLGTGTWGFNLDDLLNPGAAGSALAFGLSAVLVATAAAGAYLLVRELSVRKVSG
jgi:hypothetical protein